MVTLRELDKRLKLVEKRVKRISKALELSPAIYPLAWKKLTELDRGIVRVLIQAGREGKSTTEIAQALNLNNPSVSGRVVVYNRLKRIERMSDRLKGAPYVISSQKKWSMNWDDYKFLREESA